MPRSPTMTMSVSPKRVPTASTAAVNAVGSAVLPAKHPDRDRTAVGVGEQPVLDLGRCLSCRRGSSRGRPAGSAGRSPTTRTGRTARSATVAAGARCRAANRFSMPSWRARSQSIAAYTSSVDASATARSAPRVVSAHQRAWPASRPARNTRATINANARSRDRPGGPSSAGSPSVLRHRGHRGDVPVRQRRLDLHRLGRHPPAPAGQHRLDRGDRLVGQRRQVRQRLVFDLAALAEGAPQMHRQVLAPPPGLVHMTALDPGHVHRAGPLHHTLHNNHTRPRILSTHRVFWLHFEVSQHNNRRPDRQSALNHAVTSV